MLGICSYRLASSFWPTVLTLGEQDPCHFRAERPSRHVIGQKARPGPSPAQLRKAARELGAPPLRRVSAIHDQANTIEANMLAAAQAEEAGTQSGRRGPQRTSTKKFQRNPSHVFELMSPERGGAQASKKKKSASGEPAPAERKRRRCS